ncbi:MAG: Gfo/Idh/MocA family protein [Fimbriimonadaceae bacterium]
MLKAAIIGVGASSPSSVKGGGHQIGYSHAGAYERSPDVDLVAAADINPENLAAFQDRFQVSKTYADFHEMLQDTMPNIVSICTYVGLHMPMLQACFQANVPAVCCEKPLVNSPNELDELKRADTSTKVLVAHIRRYLPAFIKTRELVETGEIGDLVTFTASVEGWDLSEMGSHLLDAARMFAGDGAAAWVMGQARVRDQKGYGHAMEDHAIAYFSLTDGTRGVLEAGKAAKDPAIFLQGTRGQIVLRSENHVTLYNASGETEFNFADDPGSGWEPMWDRSLEALIHWMNGGPEPSIGLSNALHSAELNLAAYVSMIRGDRVDLPLLDPSDRWPVDILAERQS